MFISIQNIIEILGQLDSTYNVILKTALIICSEIDILDCKYIHILLAFFNVDDDKKAIYNLLFNKIVSIKGNYFMYILNSFSLDDNKFFILSKSKHKIIMNHYEYETIINLFNNDRYKNLIRLKFKPTQQFDDILSSIDNDNDKVSALENSISSGILNLQDMENKCIIIRSHFNSKESYIKACEILGINPDVFMNYV